jgi:hypothetical protein
MLVTMTRSPGERPLTSWWIVHVQPTSRHQVLFPKYPQRHSWGIFHVQPTSLHPRAFPKYPQRQLGDCSRTAYIATPSALSQIPPTAVGGSFKLQPRSRHPPKCSSQIPPTAVGGSFKLQPTSRHPQVLFPNTPNGSWGIFHVQPTSRHPSAFPKYPQRQLGDLSRSAYSPFTQKPFHQPRSHFAAGPGIS